jgi:hypothetical protein
MMAKTYTSNHNSKNGEPIPLWKVWRGPDWNRKLIDDYWKAIYEFKVDSKTTVKGVVYPWISGKNKVLFVIENNKKKKTIWMINGAGRSHHRISSGPGFEDFEKEYNEASDFAKPVHYYLNRLPTAEVTIFLLSGEVLNETIRFFRAGRPNLMLYTETGKAIAWMDVNAVQITTLGHLPKASLKGLLNYLKRHRGKFDIRLQTDRNDVEEIKVFNKDTRKIIYIYLDKIMGLEHAGVKQADFYPIVEIWEEYLREYKT